MDESQRRTVGRSLGGLERKPTMEGTKQGKAGRKVRSACVELEKHGRKDGSRELKSQGKISKKLLGSVAEKRLSLTRLKTIGGGGNKKTRRKKSSRTLNYMESILLLKGFGGGGGMGLWAVTVLKEVLPYHIS